MVGPVGRLRSWRVGYAPSPWWVWFGADQPVSCLSMEFDWPDACGVGVVFSKGSLLLVCCSSTCTTQRPTANTSTQLATSNLPNELPERFVAGWPATATETRALSTSRLACRSAWPLSLASWAFSLPSWAFSSADFVAACRSPLWLRSAMAVSWRCAVLVVWLLGRPTDRPTTRPTASEWLVVGRYGQTSWLWAMKPADC